MHMTLSTINAHSNKSETVHLVAYGKLRDDFTPKTEIVRIYYSRKNQKLGAVLESPKYKHLAQNILTKAQQLLVKSSLWGYTRLSVCTITRKTNMITYFKIIAIIYTGIALGILLAQAYHDKIPGLVKKLLVWETLVAITIAIIIIASTIL